MDNDKALPRMFKLLLNCIEKVEIFYLDELGENMISNVQNDEKILNVKTFLVGKMGTLSSPAEPSCLLCASYK